MSALLDTQGIADRRFIPTHVGNRMALPTQ